MEKGVIGNAHQHHYHPQRREIAEEVKIRAKIISWMIKYNVIDINNAGFLIVNYYMDKDRVINMVDKDIPYSKELF